MINFIRESDNLEIYKCPICKRVYRKDPEQYGACLEEHSAGDCCHYSDILVTQDELDKIKKVFGEIE